MSSRIWSKLNRLQLGRYAEYFAKMEFTSYGLEVFTSEVDDRGIDFVVRDKKGAFIEIQVKSNRSTGYIYALKKTAEGFPAFNADNLNLYMAVIVFREEEDPDLFLIPASAWKEPDALLRDRNYDKPGQKSAPEYGLNLSNKNMPLLKKYYFEKAVEKMLEC